MRRRLSERGSLLLLTAAPFALTLTCAVLVAPLAAHALEGPG
jgi:hypothetical protein